MWGACIVFFQAALLLGYTYAHYIMRWMGIRKYRLWHCILFLLPFLTFPGQPLSLRYTLPNLPMVVGVFWQLLLILGPVFFMLATVSVVWQSWLAHSDLPEKTNPYTLFAVSNFGSFAALLTYPFLFEMYFDLQMQQNIWRVYYVVLVVLQFYALRIIPFSSIEKEPEVKTETVEKEIWLQWLLYSAAGVVVFLAATNVLTSEVAPIPLLWIIPLSIYLLAFVLNFKQKPWCPKIIQKGIFSFVSFGILYYFLIGLQYLPMLFESILMLFLTFVYCMFCQFQLHELKPKKVSQLTRYYLVMSLGGFLGGIFVTWAIPLISSSYVEFILGLLMIVVARQIGSKKYTLNWQAFIYILLCLELLFLGPWIIEQTGRYMLVLVFIAFCFGYTQLKKKPFAYTVALVLIILLANVFQDMWSKDQYLYKERNYYGTNYVYERKNVRFLMQGTTIHGGQFQNPKIKQIPLTYYHPTSPAAQIIQKHEPKLERIAIIGLGTGALAAYTEVGQNLDFYELDPDVLDIAENYFTFLEQAGAILTFYFGDARIVMENLEPQRYDLIVVDAFSAESIPVHLLTKEALEVYRSHLKHEGMLVFHISNRYIDLAQPVFSTAAATGAYVGFKKDHDIITKVFQSSWVTLTWDRRKFRALVEELQWGLVDLETYGQERIWTDNYSNVVPYFQLQDMLYAAKKFRLF